MTRKPHPLEASLGYVFRKPGLLQQALTHRSAGPLHNERLEFLGDAVLELVISQYLYNRYPEAPEGDLSRLRARLVRRETLSAIARELALGGMLKLGAGERNSGGGRRDSTLANAVEAIIGALYLDGGLPLAESQVLALWGERLERWGETPPDTRDAKSRLQEFLQSKGKDLPVYEVVAMSGKAHARHFRVSCTVQGLASPAVGEGASRRAAEQVAAGLVLKMLGQAS